MTGRTLAPLLVAIAVSVPVPGAAASPLDPTPASRAPALVAPGLVSTALYERDLALTPDGREMLWTIYSAGDRHGTVVSSRRADDGRWGPPEIPAIFAGHSSLEPFVTADGRWLWFASTRPLPGEAATGDWNLWRAPRSATGWGAPEALPAPVNQEGDEYYPTLTRDGSVTFTAERADSLGGEDLYRCRWVDGAWAAAENLGPAVNSPGPEFNALIHPDGAWILFGSLRAGDLGGGDLYLARADGQGGFLPAVALPAPLNSPALDFCPALSPDGSTLYFSSTRTTGDPAAARTYPDLAARLAAPGNGQGDVYQVSVEVVGGEVTEGR